MKARMLVLKKPTLSCIASFLLLAPTSAAWGEQEDMIVRISEIEIAQVHLDQYKAILKEEAAASVELEPGVISIFPMFQKDNPRQVRILEIYASQAAYDSHVKSAHFQKYKTTTLKMVKSLKLVDMTVIDSESMTVIFRKLPKK
jgi:quinol monooxygenase YgiN